MNSAKGMDKELEMLKDHQNQKAIVTFRSKGLKKANSIIGT